MKYRKFKNPDVKNTYDTYPAKIKDRLLFLRELILEIAEKTEEVGEIEETLKWRSPSYLTHTPKSGTTIRLSKMGGSDDKIAISVHCQTSLVSGFKEMYPNLEYDGNRSIILDIKTKLPLEIIKHFVFSALTYHHRKKRGIGI